MPDLNIFCGDILDWVETYAGPRFHAVLTDPPYFYESIIKRFGKPDSAPAKPGSDGRFQRLSKNFIGEDWDTEIAFNPKVWSGIAKHLYDGAFLLVYGGSHTYYKVALAIEEAELIIHPNLFCWIQGQGMPYGKSAAAKLGAKWEGYFYGRGTLKSAVEPIILAQKPFSGKPVEVLELCGAGALNVDGTRFSSEDRWPTNLIIATARSADVLRDKADYFKHVSGRLDEADPVIYCNKATKKEKHAGVGDDNDHATVKPLELNSYLAKLLLPPESYAPRRLLVPFAGVMSEAIGGMLAGWEQIMAVELKEKYCNVGLRRWKWWSTR